MSKMKTNKSNYIKLVIIIICAVYAKAMPHQSQNSLLDGTEEDEEVTYEEQVRMEEKLDAYKIRCTRRFTPGVCAEQVSSVWTFDFQIQNCTERFGCPQSRRTNRFKSYRSCMRRCQSLVELFEQILDYEARNDTQDEEREHGYLIDVHVNEIQNPARRDAFVQSFPPDDDVDEASGDEILNMRWLYGDNDDDAAKGVESLMLPSDDYFLLHQ